MFFNKLAISHIILIVLMCTLLTLNLMAKSLGDPFDGDKLQNPEWKWKSKRVEGEEPEKWDVGKTKKGWLHIDAAPNRNLWAEDTTNRLYHEHSGDFDVETHVFMEYATKSIVSGVVALSESTKDGKGRKPEWVTMKLWGRGGDAILQYQVREGGINNEAPGFKPPANKPMDVYIRLAREGKTFTTWWKKKEKDEWLEVKPSKTLDLKDPIEIGIYAGNCEGIGKGDIQYEYFKDNLEPFAVSPEQKLPISWGAIKGQLQEN